MGAYHATYLLGAALGLASANALAVGGTVLVIAYRVRGAGESDSAKYYDKRNTFSYAFWLTLLRAPESATAAALAVAADYNPPPIARICEYESACVPGYFSGLPTSSLYRGLALTAFLLAFFSFLAQLAFCGACVGYSCGFKARVKVVNRDGQKEVVCLSSDDEEARKQP